MLVRHFFRVIYDYVVKLKHCTLSNYVVMDNLASILANHGEHIIKGRCII